MDKDEVLNDQEPTSPFEIDIISFSKNTIQYGIHSLLREFERHFEVISTKYKHMALTWLLATFAGIGFLMSSQVDSLIFDHYLGICIVSMIGVVGVTLIWHLDMNIYHRFWAATLVSQIRLEKKYPFLLRSKIKMILVDEGKERVFSQSLLYLIANTLLLITGGVSISLMFSETLHLSLVVGIGFFLLTALMWRLIISVGKQIEINIYDSVKDI